MGTFGKNMVPLSSQTTELKRAYLDQRAKHLEWTRAQAVGKIFDLWLAMGAPPLFDGDVDPLKVPVEIREQLPKSWLHLIAPDYSASLTAEYEAAHALRVCREVTQQPAESSPAPRKVARSARKRRSAAKV